MLNRLRQRNFSALTTFLSILMAMVIVAAFTGQWPTADNAYRSYLLQATSWLEGRLDLGQDYPWLELAIYEGKYFVSFPPFPSYVLLPFAAIFGMDTPENLIAWAVTLLGVCYALRLYRLLRGDDQGSFWVPFLYLGTGVLFISLNGWVWFFAQSMCFTLSLMALVYAIEGKGGLSLSCWACAVGCRPMVIVYLPLLFYLLWKAERPAGLIRWIARRWYWAIGPCVIAASYMLLNWARFGNPIEFGHNYLPEFTRSALGQFHLSYVPEHIQMLLRLPGWNALEGKAIFYTGETMAFWLVNPMYLCMIAACVYGIVRRQHRDAAIMIALMATVHTFIICLHKTLGAWQFGNRYMVDMLPYCFVGLLLCMPRDERFVRWSRPLLAWGAAINLIGTVATYNHWM